MANELEETNSAASLRVLERILEEFRKIGEAISNVQIQVAHLEERTASIERNLQDNSQNAERLSKIESRVHQVEQHILNNRQSVRHWQIVAATVLAGLIGYLIARLHF